MLILQRKKNQSVIIGDDIKITILDVSNEQVKIAIDAPKSVPIVREELLLAVDANKEAAAPLPDTLASLFKTTKP